jgi:hypothetical protein
MSESQKVEAYSQYWRSGIKARELLNHFIAQPSNKNLNILATHLVAHQQLEKLLPYSISEVK